MPVIETVTIATNSEPGATQVGQYGSSAPSESPEVTEARSTGKIVGLPGLPTQVLDVGPRRLSDAARERIAKIQENKQRTAAAEMPAAPAEPAPVVVPPVDPTAGTTAAAAPADDNDPDAPPGSAQTAAAPAPAPAPAQTQDERDAIIARQNQTLARLRADVEAASKSRDEAESARRSLLSEADETYVSDPTAAIRKFIASRVGAKDENDPIVAQEMDDLIADLTAARLGVSLDTAQQAKRKSTLTQRAFELEKQRRKAQEQDAENQKTQQSKASQVEAAKTAISQSLGAQKERYPHLTYSTHLDGKSPADAVWGAIQAGIQSGHIDPNLPDDQIITKAASVVDAFYKARVESLRTAITPGTTATSGPPAQQANGANGVGVNEQSRQGHGPRTITTAAASVAPAQTPQQSGTETKPKFRNDDERRQWAIRKNFPDHPAGKPR